MKYLMTAGFIFLSILGLMAQSDFRNGYIIKNDNDTVHGLINYKGNKANARKCIFKQNIDSENQLFSPNEIKGYRFTDGKNYVSKALGKENILEQIFLEYLINGIIDIYYYRDELGEHYLVDKGNSTMYELKNDEKEELINNVRYIKESKEYIGILKAIFKDSPTLSKKAETIKLNHKTLIDIAHDYHNEVCNDQECIIYEKELPKVKSTYGFIVGLNGMSISETGYITDDLYFIKNSKFGFNIFPSIGLYYKINMPFENERLYFQYEGTYSRINLTGSDSYIESEYHLNYLNDYTLTLNTFNNLVLLKYELPNAKIKPTFQIGGFARYFFKTEYTQNLEVKFESGGTYYTKKITASPFSKLDFGINCGVGLSRINLNNKELMIDLRYQRGFGLLRGLNTNTFQLSLGYQISK
jgi:hypothetical protein